MDVLSIQACDALNCSGRVGAENPSHKRRDTTLKITAYAVAGPNSRLTR
jgi:hypothetical protein